MLAYLLLAIVLPYLALIYSAFTSFTTASILQAPWTLQNAIDVATSPEVVDSIENTLLVGVISPTLCVALGVFLAYAIRRLKVTGGRVLDYLAMFPDRGARHRVRHGHLLDLHPDAGLRHDLGAGARLHRLLPAVRLPHQRHGAVADRPLAGGSVLAVRRVASAHRVAASRCG